MDSQIAFLYIWVFLITITQVVLAVTMAAIVACVWPPSDPEL